MTQSVYTQWRTIDNESLYHPYESWKVSRDINQIKVLDKSYGKTYGRVHTIYCENKNRLLWLYIFDEHKIETIGHFCLLITNLKQQLLHNYLHNEYSLL